MLGCPTYLLYKSLSYILCYTARVLRLEDEESFFFPMRNQRFVHETAVTV